MVTWEMYERWEDGEREKAHLGQLSIEGFGV